LFWSTIIIIIITQRRDEMLCVRKRGLDQAARSKPKANSPGAIVRFFYI